MKIRLAKLLAVWVLGLSQFGYAKTLGLWVFNGHEDGDELSYGTVANVVPDSTLTLSAVAINAEGSALPKIKYRTTAFGETAVPSPICLYTDLAQTNYVGKVDSVVEYGVLKVGTRGQDEPGRAISNALRVDGFGAALQGKDFSVEVILKPVNGTVDPYDNWGHQYGTIFGISGKSGMTQPAYGLDDHNGGLIYYCDEGDAEMKTTCFLDTKRSALFLGQWVHMTLTYTHSTGNLVLYVNQEEYRWTVTYATKLPIDATSFFQLGGPLGGRFKWGESQMSVAAVRVSDKALTTSEMLTLSPGAEAYESNKIVGWWRFDEGSLGTEIPEPTAMKLPNERQDTRDATCSFVRDYMKGYPNVNNQTWAEHPGVSARYWPVPKPMVRAVDGGGFVLNPNALAIGSAQVDVADKDHPGLRLYVPRCPGLALPGSLTVEGFVDRIVDTSVDKNGWAVANLIGTSSMAVSDSRQYKSFFFVNKMNRMTGMVTQANMSVERIPTGKWTHVALVYDCPAVDAPKTVTFYVNYRPIGVHTLTESEILQPNDGKLYSVGAPIFQGHDSWWGYADEVRVCRAALKPEQFLKMTTGKGISIIVK